MSLQTSWSERLSPALAQAWGDLLSSLGLLSRLPLPAHQGRGAQSAWAYPLAGAILGALAGLVGLLAQWLQVPAEGAALLALVASVALSGALHEDGLADTADGLWGGMTAARRLEIMKDSRIGAYGTMALVLSLIARWLAYAALFHAGWALPALIATGALSRGALPLMMALMPHARDNGLSRAVGTVALSTAMAGLGLALLLAMVFTGWSTLPALLAGGLVLCVLARIAMKKIGGQTGDILGAGQQVAEIAVLFSLIS